MHSRQTRPVSANTRGVDLFDAETLADLKYRAKKQLRSRMRGLRAAHPESVLSQASQRIVATVLGLPEFESALGVGLYWPMAERREVDVRALAEAALAAHKRLYFPFLQPTGAGFRTGFAQVYSVTELEPRGQRFLEPPPTAPRAERGQIDLLIVPALAAAADGHRLGYGSGFYDATLPDFCPPACAVLVVFDFQLLGEMPVTVQDVASQFIVTERRLLAAKQQFGDESR
jgi:5-formyltetrahydrofolate cyclo-ligase